MTITVMQTIFAIVYCFLSIEFYVGGQVFPAISTTSNRIVQTSASCDQTNINFQVRFEQPFRGVIYTENAFPQCVYVNGSVTPRLIYDVRIPLHDCRTRKTINGAWENDVIVQKDLRVLEASDNKFILSCLPGSSGSNDGQFTVTFSGLTVDGGLASTQLVTGAGPGASAINYEVEVQFGTGPNSLVVNRALSVGEAISYVVRLPISATVPDARIGQCWAKDGLSNIILSDERGCTIQTTGNVWGNFQTLSTGNVKVFYNNIRAWAFPTSDRVNIFCNLHLCAGSCPIINCLRSKRSQDPAYQLGDLDVLAVKGTFEIDRLTQIDSVRGDFANFNLNSVQVVTGPTILPDNTEKSTFLWSSGHVCVQRLHFAIGVALLALIVCFSVGFLIIAFYRNCVARGNLRQQSPSEEPWTRSTLDSLTETRYKRY